MMSDHPPTAGPNESRPQGWAPLYETVRSPVDATAPTESEHTPGSDHVVETGTTVVALRTDDAVVLAADRRASVGGRFVTNKRVRKVDEIHPTVAAALSGVVGHIQQFVRTMRAEARLYRHRRDEDLSIRALATLAGNVLQSTPLRVTPLLGGVDGAGAHVLALDGGGVLSDAYAAGGSGMQVAYGVLERQYDGDLSPADARRVAARAVDSASERDTASGNGFTVATVTEDGVETDQYAAVEEVA